MSVRFSALLRTALSLVCVVAHIYRVCSCAGMNAVLLCVYIYVHVDSELCTLYITSLSRTRASLLFADSTLNLLNRSCRQTDTGVSCVVHTAQHNVHIPRRRARGDLCVLTRRLTTPSCLSVRDSGAGNQHFAHFAQLEFVFCLPQRWHV